MAKRTIKPSKQKAEKREAEQSTPSLSDRYIAAKAVVGTDVRLLFRVGDFYELFNDDAKMAANVLGLTLTTRDMASDGEQPVPMAGFPYHQLDAYLAKLIAAGHRAAVCEEPVEVKPDAADLLDSPPPAPIPATLAELHADADVPQDHTIGEIIGVDSPDDLVMIELRARNEWYRKLDNAKNDHLEASLSVERIRGELKTAKERQKEALELYQEIELRGPVIPQPVAPPAEQSGTQQSLPAADDPENAWRSVPLTELPLDSIQGLGEKKREALLEACPTLGAFVDKQVEAGASGVNTVLPKGIGKAITDPLEEMLLNWLGEWRTSKQGHLPDIQPPENQPAVLPTDIQSSGYPSFTEWELMTEQQQAVYIDSRSDYLQSARVINLTAAVQSGQLAYGRGEALGTCPYVPGAEMDDWIMGWQDSERDESEALRGDLQPAGVAEEAVPAPHLFDDLDDI